MKRLGSICVGLLIAAPFYLLLIDTVSTPELIAAGVAALIAATAYSLAYAGGEGHASYRVRWLRHGWRLAISAPQQIVTVCAEIAAQTVHPQQARGAVRTAPFRSDTDSRDDRGRRVLAESLGSLTPNTIVLGVDTESEQLFVHQLRTRGSGPRDLDPLELGGGSGDRQ